MVHLMMISVFYRDIWKSLGQISRAFVFVLNLAMPLERPGNTVCILSILQIHPCLSHLHYFVTLCEKEWPSKVFVEYARYVGSTENVCTRTLGLKYLTLLDKIP